MRSISATTRWCKAVYWSSPRCSSLQTPSSTCCMASSTHVFDSPRLRHSSEPRRTWRGPLKAQAQRLLGNPAAMVGLTIVGVYVLLALTADWLPLRSPVQIVPGNRMASPSWGMPLGGDTFGRDVLSRVVFV